jgi:hypothetical protein
MYNVLFIPCYNHCGRMSNSYDTFGMRQALKTRNILECLNGFYLDVRQPQLTLQGGLTAGLGVNLGVAKAYAYGWLTTDTHFKTCTLC